MHVAYANELDFATTSNLFGLFKSKRKALKALTEIAEEHSLCKAVIGLEKVKSGSSCFGRQLKKCRGSCIGDEPRLAHDTRLLTGLGNLKIRTWPFDGPAYLQEGEEMLLIENWAFTLVACAARKRSGRCLKRSQLSLTKTPIKF